MIILLTDFGDSEYVGVMKGVMLSLNKNAKIIDLTHEISPQDVIEASWVLKNNYHFFPKDSVFCCVIDPGVGSKRQILAIRTGDYYFIAPDNGLLWETLKHEKILSQRYIPVPKEASKTFHGRDVFAQAAARIDLQNYYERTRPIKKIKELTFYQKNREGIIVRVDHFGNIITNIKKGRKSSYKVKIEKTTLTLPYYETYSKAPNKKLFLVEGSNHTLELSIKNSNANNQLKLKTGQKIKIA